MNIKGRIAEAVMRVAAASLSPLNRRLAEVQALSNLQFNLQNSGFSASLFPGGYAASATLLLEMFRFMESARPSGVLECGSGESTGLLAHYAKRNPAAHAVSLEDDAGWCGSVRRRFLADGAAANYELIHAPLAESIDARGRARRWYGGEAVGRVIAARRYDLVLVDGPGGRTGAGRGGIVKHLPDLLSDEFVLYFDDADSPLYSGDVADIEAALLDGGRKFQKRVIEGEKSVFVFASPGFADLAGGKLARRGEA